MAMSRKWRKFWTRNRLMYVFQYLVIRYLVLLLSTFSFRSVLAAGKWIGRIVCRLDARHRAVAHHNLSSVDMPMTEQQRGDCIRGMYEHLGVSTVELLFLHRFIAMDRRSYIDFENFGYLDEPLRRGKGILAVVAHLGNWELTGVAISQAGYPLHSLARPVDNPYLDRYLNRFRTSRGQSIIVKYDAVPSMTEVLKRNEVLVVQVDQDARKRGVFVDFLGRPASTTRSPALLSLRFGTPIIPILIYRESMHPMRHRVVLDPPIYPESVDGERDKVQALTQKYTARIEEFVRRHPEQWVWLHRRWKTQKEEAVKARSVDLV